MSLLLDAFKKSRQTKSGLPDSSLQSGAGLSLEEIPVGGAAATRIKSEADATELLARSVGRNLFGAKNPARSVASVGGINRNLLIALGGTILILGVGAAYLWYLGLFDSTPPIRPRLPPAPMVAAPVPPIAPPARIVAAPQSAANVADRAPSDVATATPTASPSKSRLAHTPSRKQQPPEPRQATELASSSQHGAESLNSVIGNAYRAYRSGNFDESRLLYISVIDRDRQNADALLGLGAIAQRLGEDSTAAQYYLRVLEIDPRNAVANAGMSALSRNPNSESLLKGLLREQRDSAALHFALGNIYAGQSRWGDAQTAYFNAYTIDSKNAELALNLAVSLDHLGQEKMAAQYYQRALELDVNNQFHGLNHEQIAQRAKELAR
ncbi:MAG: tetratricopeptide repeat protein [Gallionella sp.]